MMLEGSLAMQLYGAKGYGSAIVEIMLALAGRPCDFVDVPGFDHPGPARDRLGAVNPLHQVPVLVLDDGAILTETAAIALHLAETSPVLAPPIGTAERIRFDRLLIWLVANIYPTFTYGDYPQRWSPSAPAELVASTDRYRERLYLWLDKEVRAPFVLGETVSALDAYIAVLVTWRPYEAWFERHTPALMAIARTMAQTASIAAILHANRESPA